MSQPVAIENDAVHISVWPTLGGKISSIVDKADGFELLFNYPDEIPTSSRYGQPYSTSWYAGWDECFPAVASGPYPGHPYDGVTVPDHGELWGLPTTAVPAKDGITTVWHGLRFGYRMTRKLYLDGPSLVGEYTLVNLAPFDFEYVWAAHSLMALNGPVELDMGRGSTFRLSHDADGRELGDSFAWPDANGDDLTRPSDLPPKRGWKVFSTAPIERPVVVRYPARRRQVSIEYAADVESSPAYWGVWVNTGGWAGHRHFAVEPTTGRFDQLDRAARDGSAGLVGPSGRANWAVRWTLGATAG